MLPRLAVTILVVAVAILDSSHSRIAAQIDPEVRDRVVPAVVQIAIDLDVTENGRTQALYLPVGSGTIVSPDGLILTNWHVVDMAAHRDQLDAWEAQASDDGASLSVVLHEDRLVVLSTDGAGVPEPTYLAEVVAEHHALDLAVLRITGDEFGASLAERGALPFIPLGDSATVRQGDPLDVFGYPMIGGDSLTYTDGVVSGFSYVAGIDGPAWITTNATMSGGSSGGAALDRTGRLIGVPTQGTELDCRPGDTNRDGTVDEEDVGCIPTGGSIGQVRPINLAKPLLLHAGWTPSDEEDNASTRRDQAEQAAATATAIPPTNTPVPAATASPTQEALSKTGTSELDTQEEPAKEADQGTTYDVPMYQGNPARTGEMPGPDPIGEIGLLWRVETGKEVWSSPAVVDGVLYIGIGGIEDDIGAVLALDAATGKEHWRFEGSAFLSSPAVADGSVYIASLDGYLYALSAADGKVLKTYSPVGGAYCPSFSAPLIVDTMVIANFGCFGSEDTAELVPSTDPTGQLVAFDRASGTELWKFTTKNFFPFNSPAHSDGIVVIADNEDGQFSAGTVYALDASTGAELWRFDAKTGFGGTPAIANGQVFITGATGELYALDLKTGVELWRFKLGDEAFESPAVTDGVVYAGMIGLNFFALDAGTGEEIWRASVEWQSGVAPAATDSTIYLVGAFGSVVTLDRATGAPDPERRIPSVQRGDEPIYSSPVISGGLVFIADFAGAISAYGDIRANVPIANGMDVEVAGTKAVLRAAPSNAAVVRTELARGTRLQVIGEPEERDGQTWWPIEVDGGGTGWVLESEIVAAEVPSTPTPATSTERTTTPVPPTRTPFPTKTPVSPTASPLPTSTPVPPTSTPVPTATTTQPAWGFAGPFDRTTFPSDRETDLVSAYVGDQGFVISIKAPGGIDTYVWDNMPSQGRNFSFRLDVASMEGWGEIILILTTVGGDPEWTFGVDPVAQEWYLYRTSASRNELFYWIEPRSYGAIVSGPVKSLEVRVIDSTPTLWLNGKNVVEPFGIAMPRMEDDLYVGFGAGINPSSLTGHGETFTVTFERAELRER